MVASPEIVLEVSPDYRRMVPILVVWIDAVIETIRFWHQDYFEYEFFPVLSRARAWANVILAEKRDSRRHSTTSFSENVVVAGTSYQMLEV